MIHVSYNGHAHRFGRVSYLHAGGIDRPLTITKDAQEPIIPHQNWRGTFAWGTWGRGHTRATGATAYRAVRAPV
jgi:hypothetical protein